MNGQLILSIVPEQLYLAVGGSSFTTNHTGQKWIVDDRNNCTPSVFSVKDTLAGFSADKNCIAHQHVGSQPMRYHTLNGSRAYSINCIAFTDNAAVRTAGLRSIQEVLDDPRLKLTQVKDV